MNGALVTEPSANPLASLTAEQLADVDPDAVESARIPMHFVPGETSIDWGEDRIPGLSDGLMEFACYGIDAALDNIRDGSALMPFLLERGDETALRLWMADTLEEGVTLACAAAGRLEASVDAYTIVYDGYATVEGVRYDAVYAEAAERGADSGFLIAQRYKPKKGLFGKLSRIGEPMILEDVPFRFA